MEKIQNNQPYQYITGNKTRFIKIFIVLIVSMLVSSCEVIGDIFKAGMGFGIFIVLAVVVGIIFIMRRMRKRQ